MKPHFDDEELVSLTLAIVAINGWNRLNIGFRSVPGAYVPGAYNALVHSKTA